MKSKIAIAAILLSLAQPAEQIDPITSYDCDRLAMELNRVDNEIVALHDN